MEGVSISDDGTKEISCETQMEASLKTHASLHGCSSGFFFWGGFFPPTRKEVRKRMASCLSLLFTNESTTVCCAGRSDFMAYSQARWSASGRILPMVELILLAALWWFGRLVIFCFKLSLIEYIRIHIYIIVEWV